MSRPIDRTATYRSLSEAYGWTPTEIAQLTPAQMQMYLRKAKPVREDDWSQFGLYRDGGKLKGPSAALRAYSEHRRKMKDGMERG